MYYHPHAALRQAIAKAIIAYYQKYVDEQSKCQIKETLLQYDRTLLVADPRRCEPKKCVGWQGVLALGRGGGGDCAWQLAPLAAATCAGF